jgi:hypothetical protein
LSWLGCGEIFQPVITLSVRGTGWRGVLLLGATLFALFGLPRLLSPAPSDADAERAIRDLWTRQIRDVRLPDLAGAPPDSAARIGEAMAAELARLETRRVAELRIRRSLVGPPFARRWAWFVRARESTGEVGYYRLSRGFAGQASAFWWRFPLF